MWCSSLLPIEEISIHAPRTGSDITPCDSKQQANISIHAPRTGSDGHGIAVAAVALVFQSTLPARGATFFC